MTVLVVGTEEFELLVVFSSEDSAQCITFAEIRHWTLVHSDPSVSARVVIFGALQFPEANIGFKLLVSRSLDQAALLHKFLHERVNFMINLFGLQFGIRAGLPPLDFSVLAERMVLSLLARQLIELFLNICSRFTFGSFGLRLGMAAPSLRSAFVGDEKPGGKRAWCSSSQSRSDIGNRV